MLTFNNFTTNQLSVKVRVKFSINHKFAEKYDIIINILGVGIL